jgi:hypothetical protein
MDTGCRQAISHEIRSINYRNFNASRTGIAHAALSHHKSSACRSKVGQSKRCEFAETGEAIGTNRSSRGNFVPDSGFQDRRNWHVGWPAALGMAQWCRRRPIATYVLASILWTTVLYAHAATAGFASYDDASQIVQNPSLSSLAASLMRLPCRMNQTLSAAQRRTDDLSCPHAARQNRWRVFVIFEIKN